MLILFDIRCFYIIVYTTLNKLFAVYIYIYIIIIIISEHLYSALLFRRNLVAYVSCIQARREPQRGPGKHSRGTPKHFHGAPLGRKFLNFSFQNGTFWRTLYFWPTVGPPNVAGPGVANPPSTPPSRRAWLRPLRMLRYM